MIYPSGSKDTLEFVGPLGKDIISDPRGDTNNEQPIALVNSITQNSDPTQNAIVKTTSNDLDGPSNLAVSGSSTSLSDGSSGFWGLGIYQVSRTRVRRGANGVE